jgi:hypothetical protein
MLMNDKNSLLFHFRQGGCIHYRTNDNCIVNVKKLTFFGILPSIKPVLAPNIEK